LVFQIGIPKWFSNVVDQIYKKKKAWQLFDDKNTNRIKDYYRVS
jgi:hypothetical protein